MNVSIVTDEVSSDPETALEIVASWGVQYVELRGIGDQRYPRISDYWRYRLPQLLDEFKLQVVAISPGLFQVEPPGRPRRPMAFSRGSDMRIACAELDTEARRDELITTTATSSTFSYQMPKITGATVTMWLEGGDYYNPPWGVAHKRGLIRLS